jgi:hypothetical protein
MEAERSTENGEDEVPPWARCTREGHDELRSSRERFAAATTYAGTLPGGRSPLELRNCRRCGSTLAWRLGEKGRAT